jgi:hypothetical protein
MIQTKSDQDRFTAERKRGCYSLKLLDGRSRANIARALAEGESCRSIARRLHHSINTVLAVRDADWQQIEARKQRIAAQCERNATLAAEQLAERLETEKLSANQLVPVLGVSVDKMIALRGENIQTIRHLHSVDLTDDDLLAFAVQRSKRLDEKRAQAAVVEVPALPAETGLQAKKTPRKRAAKPTVANSVDE